MKIWHIAIFLFIFNMMVNIGASIDLGFQYTQKGQDAFFDDSFINASEKKINGTIGNADSTVAANSIDYGSTALFLVSGVGMLAKALLDVAINTEVFITTVTGGFLPASITIMFGMLVRLIYIIGIVQLLLGREIKNME